MKCNNRNTIIDNIVNDQFNSQKGDEVTLSLREHIQF